MMKQIQGILEVKQGGFGFVRTEQGDIYIAAKYKSGAMHGQTVEVEMLHPDDPHSDEGKIVKILSPFPQIIGTAHKGRGALFVVSDNRVFEDVFIPKSKNGGAKNGDKVVVEIEKPAIPGASPEGKIVEILGHKGDAGVDILAAARSFGLNAEFPKQVRSAAGRLAFDAAELKNRLDLRHKTIITMDGADAKDLDDAVSVEKMSNGHVRLGVHIADVSHYVCENGVIDVEARARGTSVYLLDRVIPMLPQKLSNDLCSLNEGQDKLTLSCLMELDARGEVVGADFHKTVIRSRHRMTYDAVNALLAGQVPAEYEDIYADVLLMEQTAGLLRARREELGSIDFDLEEPKITLNAAGVPVSIEPGHRGRAERIIEEFMLAANITVAQTVHAMDIPLIYRVHEQPDGEKMRELSVFLANFGMRLKGFQNIHPKAVQSVLKEAETRSEHNIINRVTLRSLKKAKYSCVPEGHFGLAADYYCHFTSPIRRYPDLCVHRVLKKIIEGKMDAQTSAHFERVLPGMAAQSSERERNAVEAERMVENKKMAEYMESRVGEEFDGVVSGVTNFGVFVELENTIEGMVPLSALHDDYYVYEEKNYCVTGQRTKKRIRLGDAVRVKCIAASAQDARIDFAFVRK